MAKKMPSIASAVTAEPPGGRDWLGTLSTLRGGFLHSIKPIVLFTITLLVAPKAWAGSGVLASWYGTERAGHHTANGALFNPYGLTAAHRTLPFGTVLQVTNLANRRQVIVVITDRGPGIRGRTLDVSLGAAQK